MTKKQTTSLIKIKKALKTLEAGLAIKKPNEYERDGIIQRFEYTFELSWKTARKVLIDLGKSNASASPKPLLREALEENLINDLKAWFDFLEARNNATHVYNSREAMKVFRLVKKFPPYVQELIERMTEKLKQAKRPQ